MTSKSGLTALAYSIGNLELSTLEQLIVDKFNKTEAKYGAETRRLVNSTNLENDRQKLLQLQGKLQGYQDILNLMDKERLLSILDAMNEEQRENGTITRD